METLYRMSAYWPIVMLLARLFCAYGGLQHLFDPVIPTAFGLGFSLANLRIPSWYSRGLGAVFGIVHGVLLYSSFTEIQVHM